MADWGSIRERRVKGRPYFSLRFPLKQERGRGAVIIEVNNRREVDGSTSPFRDRTDAEQLLSHVRNLAVEVGGRKALAKFAPRSAKLGLVREYLQEWLEETRQRVEAEDLSQNTLIGRRKMLTSDGPFAYWQNWTIHEVRPRDIKKWALVLAQRYASSTVALYVQTFRAFLAWAAAEEIIASVPVFPRLRIRRPHQPLLMPAEQKQVLSEIPERLRGVFYLMCMGVRPNSARAVQASDYRHGFFTIQRAIQGPFKNSRTVTWEKRGDWRFVPATEQLAQWIRKHIAAATGSDLLFPDPDDGCHFTHRRLQYVWKRACHKALERDVPLYRGTKHSFATGKLLEGHSPKEIAEFIGVSEQVVGVYAEWAGQLNTKVLGEEIAAEARNWSTTGQPEPTVH